jgi:hypothetical protein
MKTEHHRCPDCDKDHVVNLPENYEERFKQFIQSAPTAVLKVLATRAVGIFTSKPAGWGTAAVFIAKSIHDDGTIKCENPSCGTRFRIRT